MIDLLNVQIKELEQTILNALHKDRRKLPGTHVDSRDRSKKAIGKS